MDDDVVTDESKIELKIPKIRVRKWKIRVRQELSTIILSPKYNYDRIFCRVIVFSVGSTSHWTGHLSHTPFLNPYHAVGLRRPYEHENTV